MKATKRRNGKHMVTLQVKFHVDADMALAILAGQRVSMGMPMPTSVRELGHVLRQALERRGEDRWAYVHEQVADDEWEEAMREARECLTRLGVFPADEVT